LLAFDSGQAVCRSLVGTHSRNQDWHNKTSHFANTARFVRSLRF
jgi:hypothetical protein